MKTEQTATTIPEGLPRLFTVKKTAEIFSGAGKSVSAIWADIFKATDRYNSRGDRICGNGLAATGAVIRRGRKVLIDVDLYAAWLAGRSVATANGPD